MTCGRWLRERKRGLGREAARGHADLGCVPRKPCWEGPGPGAEPALSPPGPGACAVKTEPLVCDCSLTQKCCTESAVAGSLPGRAVVGHSRSILPSGPFGAGITSRLRQGGLRSLWREWRPGDSGGGVAVWRSLNAPRPPFLAASRACGKRKQALPLTILRGAPSPSCRDVTLGARRPRVRPPGPRAARLWCPWSGSCC